MSWGVTAFRGQQPLLKYTGYLGALWYLSTLLLVNWYVTLKNMFLSLTLQEKFVWAHLKTWRRARMSMILDANPGLISKLNKYK